MPTPKHITEQTIGGGVAYINSERLKSLANDLQKIIEERSRAVNIQDRAFMSATEEIKKLKDLLGDPTHILGNANTKHGEIAEYLEVYIGRAQDFVNQRALSATFEGVPRTAAADYILNGLEVQSKFINGTNNTLQHVIYHMEDYSYFGRNGSFYQIPKDQFEIIRKIMNGDHIAGLNLNSQAAIQNKVAEVEQMTGKSFFDVVKPGISKYSEVQQGVVFKTVDGHEQNIIQQNDEHIEKINSDATQKKNFSIDSHQPNLAEAGKAAGMGIVVAGTLSLGMGIRKKLKEGKSLTQFTEDDWAELGLDTAKASSKGGITGAALYGLTNFTNMSAPVAAACISSSFGVASLCKQYKQGEITISKLHEETQVICVDSTIVALGATVGSIVIPIPLLGALVGSITANVMNDYLKKWLSEQEQKEILRLTAMYQANIDRLDARLSELLKTIMQKYEELNGIIGMAFDFDANVFIRLDASIQFAVKMGVPEEKIIRDRLGLRDFLGYK